MSTIPRTWQADLYQDKLDAGLEEDLREQLAAVEGAEQRLALRSRDGERTAIPDERLEAVPTAELTADEERSRTAQ